MNLLKSAMPREISLTRWMDYGQNLSPLREELTRLFFPAETTAAGLGVAGTNPVPPSHIKAPFCCGANPPVLAP